MAEENIFEVFDGTFVHPEKRLNFRKDKELKKFLQTHRNTIPKADDARAIEEKILDEFILPFYKKQDPISRAIMEAIIGFSAIPAEEVKKHITDDSFVVHIVCINPYNLGKNFELTSVQGWRNLLLRYGFKLNMEDTNKSIFLNHVGIHAGNFPLTDINSYFWPPNLPNDYWNIWEIYEIAGEPGFWTKIRRWFNPGLLGPLFNKNSPFHLQPPELEKPNTYKIPFTFSTANIEEKPVDYKTEGLHLFTVDDMPATTEMPFGAIANDETQKNLEHLFKFHPDLYQIYKGKFPDIKHMFDEFEATLELPENERPQYNHEGTPENVMKFDRCICHKSNCPECKVRLSLQANTNPNKNSKFYFHKKNARTKQNY